MMLTHAQETRLRKLSARSERLARHAANCEALTAAYLRRRGCFSRAIRLDVDALLQGEGMAVPLWEDEFDPEGYLDSLPVVSQRRYRLI